MLDTDELQAKFLLDFFMFALKHNCFCNKAHI